MKNLYQSVLYQVVQNYPTKHKEGFTNKEMMILVLEITQNRPFNFSRFENALSGVTGMIKDGDTLCYHSDVEIAIRCGLEDRPQTQAEFD